MIHQRKSPPGSCSTEDLILELNGSATALLATGDYLRAKSILTDALRLLKFVLASSSAGGPCLRSSSIDPRITCVFATQSYTRRDCTELMMDCESSDDEDDLKNDAGSFICQQYIELHVPHDCKQGCIEQESEILEFSEGCTLSYAIVYNLALCQHLIGIECAGRHEASHVARSSWEQALQLYKHALQLLTGNENCVDQDHAHVSYLVILNNMGSIQECLGNGSQATYSFNLLFGAIIYYNTTGRIPEDHTQLRAVMKGFLSNILPSRSGTYNNAPAA